VAEIQTSFEHIRRPSRVTQGSWRAPIAWICACPEPGSRAPMRFDDAATSTSGSINWPFKDPKWMEKVAESSGPPGTRRRRGRGPQDRPHRCGPDTRKSTSRSRAAGRWGMLTQARSFRRTGNRQSWSRPPDHAELQSGVRTYARILTRLGSRKSLRYLAERSGRCPPRPCPCLRNRWPGRNRRDY